MGEQDSPSIDLELPENLRQTVDTSLVIWWNYVELLSHSCHRSVGETAARVVPGISLFLCGVMRHWDTKR